MKASFWIKLNKNFFPCPNRYIWIITVELYQHKSLQGQ